MSHEFQNGKCIKCGARTWESNKPCKRPIKKIVRKSKTEKYADELPDNDIRFGSNPDY